MSATPSTPAALVTGAGSGIGLEVARQLAALGWNLALAGRSATKLQDAARTAAPRALVVPTDLTQPQQAAAAVDATTAAFGRVDAVVNCAGVARLAPLSESTLELWQEALATNTIAPGVIITRAWPHFVRQRGGCIVNISSMATADPFPGLGVYAASKCGMDSLVRSAHTEGAPHHIRAFCVNPGAVETPMLRALFTEDALPRTATLDPADVARVVVDCIQGRREADRGTPIYLSRT